MHSTQSRISLVALVLAGAFAQPVFAAGNPNGEWNDYPEQATPVSTVTRAQVIKELRAAEARGEVSFGDAGPRIGLAAAKETPAPNTRAQVLRELHAAQARGETNFGDAGPRMAEATDRKVLRAAVAKPETLPDAGIQNCGVSVPPSSQC